MMFAQIKHNPLYVAWKEQKKALQRRINLPRYLGDEYRCPVCETRLSAFKPIWKSFRRKIEEYEYIYPLSALETFNWTAYSCPACDASDRERLYALYLERVARSLDRRRKYKLVEFAPSTALARKLKAHPSFEYRSADLFRRTVDDRIDLTDMRPYQDCSVDIFICSHILEHIPDDRAAMRELFRILKPEGFGIIMVPLIKNVEETQEDQRVNTPELRWKYYCDGDHVRQYGRRDFRSRLEQAGFKIEMLGSDFFGADAFKEAGIAQDSTLYVVRRPG